MIAPIAADISNYRHLLGEERSRSWLVRSVVFEDLGNYLKAGGLKDLWESRKCRTGAECRARQHAGCWVILWDFSKSAFRSGYSSYLPCTRHRSNAGIIRHFDSTFSVIAPAYLPEHLIPRYGLLSGTHILCFRTRCNGHPPCLP